MNTHIPIARSSTAALIAGLGILLFACSSDPLPTATQQPTPVTSSPEEFRASLVMRGLYVDIYENNNGGVQIPALRQARNLQHPGLIAPLVEITRFAITEQEVAELGETLHALTGESFAGDDYFSWYEWLGTKENTVLLPGYAHWKASLYAPFDASFHSFLYNDVQSEIPLHGIQWGGVARDGIPPLENPDVIPGRAADYLELDEFVFGVEINGETRAYPFRIMNSHEMANDVVGGVPVTLSYCTLCGSGILYEGMVNGQPETFGTSGFLYQSNKLMYDRTTESLWQQQTGKPVVGKLVGSGIELKILPVTVSRWEEWLTAHPDTTVLSLDQGFLRRYHHPDDPLAIYYDYFHGDDLLFPVWNQDTALEPKTRVLGVRVGETARAYIAEQVIDESVINDALDGVQLVIVGDMESGSVRAFRRGDREFVAYEDSGILVDDAGGRWIVTEDELSPIESSLDPLPRQTAQDVFWFGWTTFFPQTDLWLPPLQDAG